MVMQNHKSVEDTYASRETMNNVVSSSQMKSVMLSKTPVRYFLKSHDVWFLIIYCGSLHASN